MIVSIIESSKYSLKVYDALLTLCMARVQRTEFHKNSDDKLFPIASHPDLGCFAMHHPLILPYFPCILSLSKKLSSDSEISTSESNLQWAIKNKQWKKILLYTKISS
jgi:hypothetical protein